MKPKPIGIIGGAGPLAGLSLLEQIFRLARDKYGCWNDDDFPKVFLLSFPFSDMLSKTLDAAQIRNELRGCLRKLREDGALAIGISCNTLHAFLEEGEELRSDLLQLPFIAAEAAPPGELPLILSTSTSRRFGLYQRRFPCLYPDADVQAEVDRIILQTLKGEDSAEELKALIDEQEEDFILLGCTELSLYANQLLASKKQIIDPLNLMAKKIIEKSFGV